MFQHKLLTVVSVQSILNAGNKFIFSAFDLGFRKVYLWVLFFKMERKSQKLSLLQTPFAEKS